MSLARPTPSLPAISFFTHTLPVSLRKGFYARNIILHKKVHITKQIWIFLKNKSNLFIMTIEWVSLPLRGIWGRRHKLKKGWGILWENNIERGKTMYGVEAGLRGTDLSRWEQGPLGESPGACWRGQSLLACRWAGAARYRRPARPCRRCRSFLIWRIP